MRSGEPSGILTLLTDFGTRDPFVGVMKGVVASRARAVEVIDLTHELSPQGVTEAAFWLERSYRWFPEGTVHVAVVDPGVGTERRALVVQARGHLFVAPDNGLLGPIAAGDAQAECYAIDLDRVGLPAPSHTFHGRDVFAPIGADLALGRLGARDVGPRAADIVSSCLPRARHSQKAVTGVVVTIDRFGNLISNIAVEDIEEIAEPVVAIGSITRPLQRTYADATPLEYVAVVNAFGTVELARRNGSAAEALGVERGEPVMVRRAGQKGC